ncbi:MAG: hypothetical protein V3U37_03925 [Nitrospinaceae bacterium]
MDQSDAHQDKEYEELNDAILKAIISSDEVKQLLMDFRKKNLIDDLAVLNLILSLEELCELMSAKAPAPDTYKVEPSPDDKPSKKLGSARLSKTEDKYSIDGKVLSDNEIKFEEFYRKKFDEGEWLKKAKIRL